MVELLKTTFWNRDPNEDSVIFVIDVWDKETVELVSERMVVGGGANTPWTFCPDFDGNSETVPTERREFLPMVPIHHCYQ